MAERVTNAEIAVALAEIKKDISHLRDVIGEKPNEGLRGEVAILVGIKNKGWGFVVGLLLLAGGIGAAVKSAIGDLLK